MITKKSFIVKAIGDSMTPTINPGDICACDPFIQPSQGDIVLISHDGKTKIKRFDKRMFSVFFTSDNIKYDDIKLSDFENIHVRGKITHIVKEV